MTTITNSTDQQYRNNTSIDFEFNTPSSYIILPAKTYGAYSYPNTLVSKYNNEMNVDTWHNAHKELQERNCVMLTPRQFIDLFTLIQSGNAFDGAGKKISKKWVSPDIGHAYRFSPQTLRSRAYNEIFQERFEWLDAQLISDEQDLFIQSRHIYSQGKLQAQSHERIPLHTDRNRSMESIDLKTCTELGIPTRERHSKKDFGLDYHPPQLGIASAAAFCSSINVNRNSARTIFRSFSPGLYYDMPLAPPYDIPTPSVRIAKIR